MKVPAAAFADRVIVPGEMFDGRYEIKELLRQSRDVQTALVLDTLTGDAVVLKSTTTACLTPEAMRQLADEAALLAQLDCPWIAPLLDVGEDGELLYVSRPFVDGQTLQERLLRGPLDLGSALIAGRCLFGALAGAHAAGVLHGDLKPSNFVVTGSPALTSATLLDFGLARMLRNLEVARSAELPLGLEHEIVGTLRYMAPEQVGLLERPADERADLYAAGTILFECLAGRPLFSGDSAGELLRQHLTGPVPFLRSLGLPVPHSVDDLVQRLLRKDPDDRYQTAAAAAADLDAIVEARRSGVTDPKIVVGSLDRRRSLTEPCLAGRGEELSALERSVSDARLGRGTLVLVEGESGVGKSRLLDELGQRLSGTSGWVLSGQAVSQVAPAPFQALSGVVADIVTSVRRDPGVACRLRRALGDHIATAGKVLPELRSVLTEASDEPPVSEFSGEERTIQALVALLAALGCPERPAVVLIDDCQWADDLTNRLLGAWLAWTRSGPGPSHTTVIASFRSEEVDSFHLLRTFEAAHIRLRPLGPPQVSALVESMAGSLPRRVIELIQRVSHGNPFMASAALRGLVEAGALTNQGSGWRFDETTSPPQWSSEAATLLAERLHLISPGTRELLRIGAVIGKSFPFELAASMARLGRPEVEQATWEAHDRHLMWTDEVNATGTFAHDRLRDAFLALTSPEEQSRLHLEVAERLEATEPTRVFDLAYHFDAGGLPARALPSALEAARQARARYLLELAEMNSRIAERGAADGDRSVRKEVLEELGQVLMLRGKYDEAGERLERAALLAGAPTESASLSGQLSELAVKRGDMAAAASHLESALAVLGERVPRGQPRFVAELCREIVVRQIRSFRRHTGPTSNERDLLTARLYNRLIYAWWFWRPSLATLWAAERLLNAAKRCPAVSAERAHACATYAPAIGGMLPVLHRRALRFSEQARGLTEELGDLWGQGVATSFQGVVLYGAGRYDAAIAAADDAMAILTRTGDPWELNVTRWHKAMASYRLGNLADAVSLAQALERDSAQLGDAFFRGIALGIWSKASGGRVSDDEIADALDRAQGAAVPTSELLQGDGVRLLAGGHTAEAIDRFQCAVDLMWRSRHWNNYVVSSVSWLATACRQAAEEASPLTPADRRRRVRRARRVARRAVFGSRFWPQERPHALREAGLVAALTGRHRRARRLMDRALQAASDLAMREELAETFAARARIGLAAGWVGAEQDLSSAEEVRRTLRAVESSRPGQTKAVDLADRYRTLLEAGRRITAAGSVAELLSAVTDAGSGLLRSEHCRIWRVGTDGTLLPPLTGNAAATSDARIVAHAVAEKRPVVLAELAGVRSALSAPILVHGEPVACLVATHGHVADLFGEDEVHLADFVVELAGAALEREELQREMRARVLGAQEEERARIARDLHDEIGQALTSVLVGLRRVETSIPTGTPDTHLLQERTREVHDSATAALGQVKHLASELWPSVLDDMGLLAAVQRLAVEVGERHELTVDVATRNLQPDQRLDPQIETTAYRVVQEALTNVARHARATVCSIVLARHDGYLRVVVEDDGRGFDPALSRTGSLGLRGMAERAALVGGRVEVTSSPAQGTTVVLDVLLPVR